MLHQQIMQNVKHFYLFTTNVADIPILLMLFDADKMPKLLPQIDGTAIRPYISDVVQVDI